MHFVASESDSHCLSNILFWVPQTLLAFAVLQLIFIYFLICRCCDIC